MTDNKIKKANDILDKFEFFNQRAGRELWSDKPKDIQDKDIENFSNYVKFLKDFINRQKAENERLKNNVFCKVVIDEEKMKNIIDEKVQEFELDIKSIKAEAIKEFAERLKANFEISSGYSFGYIACQIDNLILDFTKMVGGD